VRFLNPTIFYFLGAAAIPLIIHLISRSKTKKIKFSTVRFIKELEHDTIRNFRIKQWLLILIRTLIIIFLVLVFARPVSKGFIPEWLAGTEALGVILVDNSASMATTESKNISRLKRQKQSVLDVLQALDNEIEISIYQTNPPKLVYEGKNQFSLYQKSINSIVQSHGKDNLWENLELFLDAEVGKNIANMECFIFSDFQTLPDEDISYFKDASGSDSSRWRFYLFPNMPLQTNNSIRDASPESRVHQSNHLFRMNTRIMNDGKNDSRQIPIQLFVNDERVGQVVSMLGAGKSKEFLFQAYPGSQNIIKGEIRIPDDDFELDNSFTFDIPLPDKIACKLVASSQEDMVLLELALKSIDLDNELIHLDAQVIPDINRLYLDDYDVLILHDPEFMSNKALSDVQSFLRKGGGVIWFAGEGQGRISEQKGDLALNLPIYLGDTGFKGDAYYTLNIQDKTHSLLSDLNLRDIENELPIIHRYVDSRVKPDHEIILSLNNDRPFLIECPSNNSRIIYFASIIDMEWNDFALRGLFVPILHRLIQYLATDERNTRPILVGEEKIIHIEKELLKSEWTLLSPSGNTFRLIPDYNKELLPITQTNELGRSILLADGLPFTSFSTNLSPGEYPSNSVNMDDFSKIPNNEKLRIISTHENLTTQVKEIRLGKSLWRTFLTIVIFLVLLEMVLGRINKDMLKNDVRINE